MKTQDILSKYTESNNILEINALLEQGLSSNLHLKGLNGSSKFFALSALYKKCNRTLLLVMNDMEGAAYAYNDMESILGDTLLKNEDKRVFFFPTSYKRTLRKEDTDSMYLLSRTEVINVILSNQTENFVIVTYPEALFEKIIKPDVFISSIFQFRMNEEIDYDGIIEKLYDNDFERVDFTIEPGQFSIRGGIIDVFSFAHENPFRIELSGNKIASLRTFDVVSQISLEKLNKIEIVPNINKPLEGTSKTSFFELLQTKTLLGFEEAVLCLDKFTDMWQDKLEANLSNNDYKHEFLSPSEVNHALSIFTVLNFGQQQYFDDAFTISFKTAHQPVFNKNFDLLFKNLRENTQNILDNFVFSGIENQIKRLTQIFDDLKINNPRAAQFKYEIIASSINEGFLDYDLGMACYTDHQIFERYHRYRIRDSYAIKQSKSLKELSALSPGDYISHIDYGVGRFDGLEKIDVNGKEQEALRIIYKDNDLLYLSIHSLHKISKYSGQEGKEPHLSKIGSPAWQNLKNKTKSRVKDIAKELIKLYAQRKSTKGHAFNGDTYLQHELEASFIYEDTPDQVKATLDVKKDLEADYPMDRLVCGDVGFGKTEIAIRAAFKAVTENKQVAVLVPTTILALQHFNTFKERLKDFPCTIDYVSRLKPSKKIQETLSALKKGHVDIIIGTHRIVSKDVAYKDLGLLIIDEEQKFGVSIKEKLKQIKVNVDTLTLTATPIPRTLQFSLMGARDLSIINTPPPNRYPILTEIIPFNEEVIRNAIHFELSRGGQVFFVNNRIQNIYELSETLKRWMPRIRIAVGHGQMQGPQLEQTMIDFTEGQYDVLLATTIIESGLDIPNVNTIIINNAPNFGLSELHQLRGRVGRSNKKAFCYLVCPPLSTLTNDARKRIKAIEEFSELGSGMNIAMRDLDIRGSGNLLGAEQSGFISEIGFDMYHRILDEAMAELKASEFSSADNADNSFYINDCVFESDMEILIPSSYITNIAERLLVYKEINDLESEDEILIYMNQLTDRFGEIPFQTIDLFQVVKMRWIGKRLGFEKMILKNAILSCYFIQNQESNYFSGQVFSNIINFVQEHPKDCQLKEKNNKLVLSISEIEGINNAFNILCQIENAAVKKETA